MSDHGAGSGIAATLLRTGAVVLLTIALLMAPDILQGPLRGQFPPQYNYEGWISVAVIATALTLMPSRRARIATIALIAVSQIVWHGIYGYFGSSLRPEQVILFFSEVGDTVEGALSEAAALAVVALVVLVPAGILWVLHARGTRYRILRLPGAGLLLLILLLGIGARWAFWRSQVVNFPGDNSASVIATYHAAVSASRFAFAPPVKAPSHIKPEQQAYSVLAPASEPVTVMMILGESINPRRLSVLGGEHDTTPVLNSWHEHPPSGLVMSARFGFSMGVATLSSLPSLIRTSPVPVDGLHTGANVFDLAQKSGFRSAYISGQQHHFLNAAGGAPGAAMIETVDENRARFTRQRDELLVEFARQFTADPSRRQFLFIHQRVNHNPYNLHCAALDAQVNIFNASNRPGDHERQIAYDNGLRCWDRNIARLIDVVMQRPGAVYIFIAADHNEFMGEDGMWGHLHPRLDNALVPFILLTNRPQSPAKQRFDTMPVPSFYHLVRAMAVAMDVELAAPEFSNRRLYVNRTLPFGIAGYLEAEKTGTWRYDVRAFSAQGQQTSHTAVDLSDVAAAEQRVRSRTRQGNF